jgi:tetratricopeptide (TPR) repeat protein
MSRSRNPFISGRLFCLASLLALGACATAKKPPVSQHVAALDREALDAFAAGEFPRARGLLRRAIAAGEKAGAGRHGREEEAAASEDVDALARAYLDLGAVYLAEGDRGEALRNFGLALSLAPDIDPSADIGTPALKKVLAVARVQVKRGRGAAAAAVAARRREVGSKDGEEPKADQGPEKAAAREAPPKEAPVTAKVEHRAHAHAQPDDEPDLPANVTQPLYCPVPDEAPPSEEVPLRCVSGPAVDVASMMLFYRPAGSESFTPVPMMRSRKGWYEGVVPASALVGKTLQYYVEARTPAKEVATTNGTTDSPNLMIIREGAAPVGRGTLAAARFRRDRAERAPEVEEDPLARSDKEREEQAAPNESHRRVHAIWVGMGIGSGFGWHPKRQLEFRYEDQVDAGLSSEGLLHVTPEIGWMWTSNVALSLQTRHQVIPETGSGDDRLGSPAHGALAVLLRIYRYFGNGQGQPFINAAVGVGDGFRLYVPPHPEVNVIRNDTIRGGPFLVGAGGGYLYNFNSHFGLVAESRILYGLPDKAAILEVSGGGQLAF